jgi:adenylosuccinate lyase
MSDYKFYESPLVTRYASREMAELFGERTRILTWRRIWLALAKAQHAVGLPVTSKQIEQLERTIDEIDFAAAARHEKRLRHDVMAHLHTWGEIAPEARGILHLGATSADIVDNADLIIMRDALRLLAGWLAAAIDALGDFAARHRDFPTLGFTHYQPAQVTTVGKRATLWCWDLVRDLEEIERRIANLRFRGIKGATGTQRAFGTLRRRRGKVLRSSWK